MLFSKVALFLIVGSMASAMTVDEFEFISGLLHSGKMDRKMDCSMKVRQIKEERSFSSGKKLVEYLQIHFTTGQLGPRSRDASIPIGAIMKKSIQTNKEWGTVEQIKIEIGDARSTWVEFQHTGDRLVQFEIGDEWGHAPCGLWP